MVSQLGRSVSLSALRRSQVVIPVGCGVIVASEVFVGLIGPQIRYATLAEQIRETYNVT